MSNHLRGTGLETAADFKNWSHPMEELLEPFVSLFGRAERPPDRGKMLLACLFMEAELKGAVLALIEGIMRMHPELPYENKDQLLKAATSHLMTDFAPGAIFEESPDIEKLRKSLRDEARSKGAQ